MNVDTVNDNIQLLKPTRKDAEEAVRTLISWVGENPDRPGLVDTPKRVIDAYLEFFAGYKINPKDVLSKTFKDIEGYHDIVLLKDIRLESHCEHHLVPIIGVAHVAYVPQDKIVGLSKLARLVEVYGKRMQAQERLTVQIAQAIETYLQPKGVAVMIEAYHQCMTTRGIHKTDSSTITSQWLGCFKEESWKKRFLESIG